MKDMDGNVVDSFKAKAENYGLSNGIDKFLVKKYAGVLQTRDQISPNVGQWNMESSLGFTGRASYVTSILAFDENEIVIQARFSIASGGSPLGGKGGSVKLDLSKTAIFQQSDKNKKVSINISDEDYGEFKIQLSCEKS